MELQQQNIIKAQQQKHTITAMTDAKSTAKVSQIVATQTKLVKQPETQAQTPLMYNIAQDDNSEQLANDIEMEYQYQLEQDNKRKADNVDSLIAHFESLSPSSMDIAHVMASSSSMASSSHIPPSMVGIQLNEPNKRSPEEEHEPKGRRGRPRKKTTK